VQAESIAEEFVGLEDRRKRRIGAKLEKPMSSSKIVAIPRICVSANASER